MAASAERPHHGAALDRQRSRPLGLACLGGRHDVVVPDHPGAHIISVTARRARPSKGSCAHAPPSPEVPRHRDGRRGARRRCAGGRRGGRPGQAQALGDGDEAVALGLQGGDEPVQRRHRLRAVAARVMHEDGAAAASFGRGEADDRVHTRLAPVVAVGVGDDRQVAQPSRFEDQWPGGVVQRVGVGMLRRPRLSPRSWKRFAAASMWITSVATVSAISRSLCAASRRSCTRSAKFGLLSIVGKLLARNLDPPQPSRRDVLVAAQRAPPGSEAGDPMRTCHRARRWG